MKYHHVCTQCGNTVPEADTNIVITDIMDTELRNKQVYCPECFKGLTKDTIAKNKKQNRSGPKYTKSKDEFDTTNGCCGGH